MQEHENNLFKVEDYQGKYHVKTLTVGTTGRAIDHIGFEVKNLEAFTKKLEAQGIKLDRPYTKVPQLGIAIAFMKDPWGTNIEMTEGLADIK